MPEIIEKSIREYCFEGLSSIDGKELERSANLTSPAQFELVQEGLMYKKHHSKYVPERNELYLRLTLSYGARYREDMDKIGCAPVLAPRGFSGGPESWD